MDFGTAFAIGSTLLSFVGGGSGGDSTAGGGGMDIGGSSGGIGSALGFIQKGAKAYNTMRGMDAKNPQPFKTASAQAPRYSLVVLKPLIFNQSRAALYLSSGLSPKVNNAS